MASVESSWSPPPPGTYDVAVGQSLSRALKARKGETVRPKIERELYSFRYNFRPESVDTVANGTLTVKKGDDHEVKVSVERASQTDSGGHSFVGSAPAAKEFDCVIIFDPQTMTFTMEKVDSSVQLSYDRKTSHGPRSAASPMPVSSASSSRPSTSSSSGQPLANRTKQFRQPVEDIGADEDAEGEIDDEFLGLLLPTTKPPTAVPKKDASNGKGKKVDSSNRSNKQAASTWPLRQDDDSEPEEALSKQIRPPPPAPAPAPTPTPVTAPKAKAAGGAKAARGTASAAMKKAKKAAQASSVFRSFPKPTLPPAPAAAPTSAAAAAPSATPSSATLPASRSAPSTVNAAKQAPGKREREGEPAPVSEVVAPAGASQPRLKRQKIGTKVEKPKVEKPREPVALALPGTEFNLPGSVSAPAITPSSAAQSSNVAAPSAGPPDDSEEEEWDVIEPSANEPSANEPSSNEPASSASHPPPMRSIHMEVVIPESNPRPEHPEPVDGSDGMVAGDDDFLMDIFDDEPAEDEAQPEDDDFLETAFEESQPSNPPPPVSMNDLAKEALGSLWGEEDEDTSDDSESDDE